MIAGQVKELEEQLASQRTESERKMKEVKAERDQYAEQEKLHIVQLRSLAHVVAGNRTIDSLLCFWLCFMQDFDLTILRRCRWAGASPGGGCRLPGSCHWRI